MRQPQIRLRSQGGSLGMFTLLINEGMIDQR